MRFSYKMKLPNTVLPVFKCLLCDIHFRSSTPRTCSFVTCSCALYFSSAPRFYVHNAQYTGVFLVIAVVPSAEFLNPVYRLGCGLWLVYNLMVTLPTSAVHQYKDHGYKYVVLGPFEM